MNNTTITNLGQTMIKHVLPNGLCVCLFPKKGFQKKYAMYAVNFGSVDSVFAVDGQRHDTPAGVAHFLEHKVFEQKEGNALQMFASTGASPNAFTGRTMTAYHFECVDNFYDNLEILLNFVNNPYFTPENVEKEQGIIGQEIGMVNDNADWRAYNSLYEALYPDHTIRESIIGTVESIGKITDQLLYKCHGTFYRPNNMVLTVCGDVDFEKICQIAEKIVPQKPKINVERIYETGEPRKGMSRPSRQMEIFTPMFMVGFRDVLPNDGMEFRKHIIKANLASEYLMGSLSPLFNELYARNVLKRDFGAEYSPFPNGGVLMAGGESVDPELVCTEILKQADKVRNGEFDSNLFDSIKKSLYGMDARIIDSPESLCVEQTECYFHNTDFLSSIECYNDINENDVRQFISNVVREDNYEISTVYPLAQNAK